MRPFVLHGDEAADLAPGTWLLEASAGTGKTYTIVGIVIRLVVEQGLPIERCVVMTFTRAATAELRERLRQGLHDALHAITGGEPRDDFFRALGRAHAGDETARRRLLLAIAGLDAALIATIHGVCHRLLGDHAVSAGIALDADLDQELETWRRDTVHDLLRDWTRRLSPAGAAIVGEALHPATVGEACKRMEHHPEATLVGDAAIGPAEVERRLDHVRAHWDQWRSAIAGFYADLAGILGAASAWAPQALAARLDRIGACLADLPAAAEMHDLLRPLLDPNHDPKRRRLQEDHVRRLQATAWFQGLAALVVLAPGVRRHLVEAYRQRLLARPRSAHHLHFQDLLTALDQALTGPDGADLRRTVAERYDVALVDEFQDTDPLQWRILSQIFAGGDRRLFLIGDPKQAIYAFRGADVHAYLEVAASDDLRRATLGANYRSDAELVAAINHCFDRGPRSFVEEAIGFQPVAGTRDQRLRCGTLDPRPLQLWWQEPAARAEDTRAALARATAAEILRLCAEATLRVGDDWRPVRPGDIAILVRSHFEGELMAAAIAELPQRIACLRQIRISVFAGTTARAVATVLGAVLAPHRERAVRAAALTRLCGLTPADLTATGTPALEALMVRLRDLRTTWLERGFLAAWQDLLDHGLTGTSPRVLLARGEDGERALTDLLHLGDLLGAAEHELGFGADALLAWLRRHLAGGETAHDDQLLRLESDSAAVRILTIHASKGLEFPIVFAPFLWAGAGADDDQLYHVDHRAHWHFGRRPPPEVRRAQARDALAETLRLAYVALTRAAHRCYTAFAPQPARGTGAGCTTSALTWLAGALHHHRPDQLPKNVPVADPEWQATVRAAFAHDAIALVATPAPADRRRLAASPAGPSPERRPVAAWSALTRRRWFSSYSGLVRNRPVDEPDHDQVRIEESVASDPLPRGARFGSALHAVFERADFAADRDALYPLCATALEEQGFGEEHAVRLGVLVDRVLASPLPEDGTPLRSAAARRRCELEVLLPVARRTGIAEAFAAHGGPWADYASDIADIELPGGYFTGIIDLLFQHRGRVHILDWKSNDLARRGGYDQDALAAEMRHHHYVLQYHLYAVAVHRLLRRRLPDYRYERDVGAAHYLFVRGVDGSGAGWYRHRPSAAMIAALDACFAEVPDGR